MPTNKIQLRTTEEFMESYRPVYNPLYGLLLGRSKQYAEEVGKVNFNRLAAVGDLRSRPITPKDTEIFQVSAISAAKSFKKGFKASQYTQSKLQESGDVEGVITQVLDEHQKQFDEIVLTGEGTAANNVVNNGLYWSADPNYDLKTSEELANAPDTQTEFYELMMANLSEANELSGRKAIVVYGATALSKLDSLFPEQAMSLKSIIDGAIAQQATIVRMPSAITPSSANGWMILNLDQIMFHYLTLPKVSDQGVNAEKMYSWHNFLMGTAMVEVEAPDGIIRQPVTFEA